MKPWYMHTYIHTVFVSLVVCGRAGVHGLGGGSPGAFGAVFRLELAVNHIHVGDGAS